MTVMRFTVAGTPAPQGSKAPWGSEANPETRPWRATVRYEAMQAVPRLMAYSAPVSIHIDFVFARPKSHYRTGRHAGLLKPDAPTHKASKPDIDKLARAILDALTGVCYRDDSQVAELTTRKLYGEQAGAHITVTIIDCNQQRVAA